MFVIYGIDERSESFGGATHLALLTLDEALDLEFGDFVREGEEPAPFEDRLVVVDGFTDLARRRGVTAAEYLGRELIGNFLLANPGQFFPFLPRHEVAYVGPVQGGHLRALVREKRWAVDVAQDLSGPLGVVLTKGVAGDPERAKAQALEAAYRVLRAL
jgi:sugar phosphate isomerase/epimerase